jgi:16S rRNA (cytosine967-C5)-methyltransferase
MSHNIRERQFEICSQTLQTLVKEVFTKNHPLDQSVRKIFRAHKSWGGKDRRFYSETIYAFFRWYGWFKHCIPLDHSENWLKVTEMSFKLSSVENTEEALAIFKAYAPTQEFKLDWLVPSGIREELVGSDEEFYAFIEQQQSRPPVWLRCRQAGKLEQVVQELKAMGLEVQVHKTVPLAIKVVGRFNIQLLPSYKAGLVEVQDFASQCIGLTTEPKGAQKWLDACAGTGGKTMQLYDLRQGKGTIMAMDIRKTALDVLKKRIKNCDQKGIKTTVHDFSVAPLTEKFDGILVDAPCSNSGTWRRNPALRWSFSQQKVKEIAELQLKILENASKSVRKGGILVYSTCSVCHQENEGVVENFLQRHPEFQGVPIKHPITRAKQQTSLALASTLADNDTMFVAKFKRV